MESTITKLKTYECEVSYLVPQNVRGWVDAENEEDAKAQMATTAKKQGYVAFRVDKLKELEKNSPDQEDYDLASLEVGKAVN
jgi:hypothetical protein